MDSVNEEATVLNYVHNVEYVVRNRDEMVAYMERNFGIKPDKLLESEAEPPKGPGVWKEAQYRVGPTLLRIRQPVPRTQEAEFLEKNGPGIHGVSWAVDNISQVAQELIAKGNTLRHEGGIHLSPVGYYTITFDAKDSFGIHFPLAEEIK